MRRNRVGRRVAERVGPQIRKGRAAIFLPILAAGLAVTACGTGSDGAATGSQSDGVALAESNASRSETAAPQSDVESVAGSIELFGADLYGALVDKAGDGNLVFSPTSIATALAMTYAGAAGATAEQMAATLHFTLDGDALHQAFNSLDAALEARNIRQQSGKVNEGVQINVANSPWAQKGYEFKQVYLDTLAANYGAGVRLVDYSTSSGAHKARQAINDWVAEETNDKILDFIPPDYVERAGDPIVLMLVNAVYLNATWADQFIPWATEEDREFATLAGRVVTAPMMHQTNFLPYAAGDGWQAVELPYVGGEVAMLFIVPDEGRLGEIESLMESGLIGDVAGQLSEGPEILLGVPKFEFRWKDSLKEVLAALGMHSAFDRNADGFRGMTTKDPLYISDVAHEAYIAVDEQGTEAAAATGVTVAASASTTTEPIQVVELTIDRPFIFAVRDRETGAILFLGRVTDPTK
jgi:serpin B